MGYESISTELSLFQNIYVRGDANFETIHLVVTVYLILGERGCLEQS